MKKIVLPIVALIVVAIVLIALNLGSVVKTIAERAGSQALGVRVSIGSVNIDTAEKKVTVRNIKLANPTGFKKPHIMKVGLVNIDMESFDKELLVFSDITVSGAELFLEVNKDGTNVNALKANAAPKEKPAESVKDNQTQAPKVIIKHFLFDQAKLTPSILLMDKVLDEVDMPKIELTDIGVKDGGTTTNEAIGQIWGQISAAALKTSAKVGFLYGLNPGVLGVMGISNALLKDSGVVDKTKEGLGKATDGLKGLFGK